MKLELEEDTFQLVLDKIRRTKGLDFSLYRPGTIKRRLQARSGPRPSPLSRPT